MLHSTLLAAATLMRSLFLSSYSRQCTPKLRSQYAQSAAPPAMVPSRYGLISMIFLTVPEAARQARRGSFDRLAGAVGLWCTGPAHTDVGSLCRTRVHRNQDASLELEREGGRSLGKLDVMFTVKVPLVHVKLPRAVRRRLCKQAPLRTRAGHDRRQCGHLLKRTEATAGRANAVSVPGAESDPSAAIAAAEPAGAGLMAACRSAVLNMSCWRG